MNTPIKKRSIFLYLANILVVFGLVLGLWFINVGIGMGHETHVPGDAIFGLLIMVAATLLSLLFIFIAAIRKEKPRIGYLLPILVFVAMLIFVLVRL